MELKLVTLAVSLFLGCETRAQSVGSARQDLPKFMGRDVTIIEPELEDGLFPKGPASVCVEGPPQRLCFTAPKQFGKSPTVIVVQLKQDLSALLFKAESGGVSGWTIHFSLLRTGTGRDLEESFLSDTSVSNQSQYSFWNEVAISDAQIFVTADYVWGPDEGHYGEHRYIISAYVLKPLHEVDDVYYYLEDRYMTARRYDLDANADVLTSEKQEMLTRLRRLKSQAKPR